MQWKQSYLAKAITVSYNTGDYQQERIEGQENIVLAADGATTSLTQDVERGKQADAYPHAACLTKGAPGLVMGPCIVEIDRIVIRDVQYPFEFQGSSANRRTNRQTAEITT
ncbi:hypothetical protein DPMN_034037 [Dreissena polymorpha]|uniref:Uncharacterized protein n=1 Tax=Dreissena polymorpha TaxID=45954 RepID=A0A9D4M751_DREPO|nr:hypothetical protein DPMN_034037 [Dreissena polymorpha]